MLCVPERRMLLPTSKSATDRKEMCCPLKRKFQSITNKCWSLAAIVVILVLWQAVSAGGLVPGYMLPSPVEVVQAFISEFPLAHGEF